MSKDSPASVYSVALSPKKMSFNPTILGDFLKKDYESVHSKGMSMFLEIEKSLRDLEKQYDGEPLNIHGANKEFSDIMEMLNEEKSRFQDDIQTSIKNEPQGDAVWKILNLNVVRLDMLLEACIWDRRLHDLHPSDPKQINSNSSFDKASMWAPFSDIRHTYMENLQSGNLPKFESFGSYAAESVVQKVMSDEGSRLHIPLGSNDYILSDYDNELSSVIACALAFLMDPSECPESSIFDGLYSLNSSVSHGVSHCEISMGKSMYSGEYKYSVVCVYSREFRLLRELCCLEAEYIASLSRCKNWDAEGGKGKSFAAKMLDDWFIVREIESEEYDAFMNFAGSYFKYLKECNELGSKTCLAKILGIYQVVVRAANGEEIRHNVLVMENLSSGRRMDRQYDIKGAPDSRASPPSNSSAGALLDQNFIDDMKVSPLYVSRESKRHLQQAVWNDTSFLSSCNVMDYSLAVGVDTQCLELVCGIVDYLKQFTWDKELRYWIMTPFTPKDKLSTVLPPKQYKKRFRKFVDTHFLSLESGSASTPLSESG